MTDGPVTAPAELQVTVEATDTDVVSDELWAEEPTAIEERATLDGRITLVAGFATLAAAEQAARTLAALHLATDCDVTITEIADDSWLDRWREHARPVRAGRFLVAPAWLDGSTDEPDQDTVCLRLDPGRTFGSGSHPTTRLVLRAVEQLVTPGVAVLDVGCGSGVLAIAAAALGAQPVVAIDIDPAAVTATMANAETNGLADRISVSAEPLSAIDRSFDVVLANLLASTIDALAEGLASHVAAGGHLVLSGMLADRWSATTARFPDRAVTSVETEGDWAAVTLG